MADLLGFVGELAGAPVGVAQVPHQRLHGHLQGARKHVAGAHVPVPTHMQLHLNFSHVPCHAMRLHAQHTRLPACWASEWRKRYEDLDAEGGLTVRLSGGAGPVHKFGECGCVEGGQCGLCGPSLVVALCHRHPVLHTVSVLFHSVTHFAGVLGGVQAPVSLPGRWYVLLSPGPKNIDHGLRILEAVHMGSNKKVMTICKTTRCNTMDLSLYPCSMEHYYISCLQSSPKALKADNGA